ncbi:efflux RND transporter periplasmic adaptor subunit [Terrimonas alba]|uniref:efflux RND transporter periplasmic adaptor subunit n=1 Tax=Terrimonas alba TaxID=3349636 RepID=UPI0035F3BB50
MFKHTRYRILTLICLVIVFVGCNNQEKDAHTNHLEKKLPVYTCPMHPEIIRNAPGTCPVCGMDLVKKEEEVEVIQNIELNDLLQPTNAFVISSIPVTAIKQSQENIELDVLGNVVYDTRQIGTIASRVSGRIEKLYVKYKYQRVQKGQKVMEIYSPELATAQQNLLFLLKNDPANTSLINAARDRLALLGFSKQQINHIVSSKQIVYSVSIYSNYSGFATDFTSKSAIAKDMNPMASPAQELSIKEGMYLQKGQGAFSVYNADKVWILLNLYPEQQALITVGNAVHIVPETAPQHGFRSKITYIEPVFREGSKTLAARVYFDNSKLHLPVGSRVRATIFGNTKDAVWLPGEAVLSLGKNKIVFVKESGGFRAKQISTGLAMNNSIQVINGLSATDSVAANVHYLVDNEAFISIK